LDETFESYKSTKIRSRYYMERNFKLCSKSAVLCFSRPITAHRWYEVQKKHRLHEYKPTQIINAFGVLIVNWSHLQLIFKIHRQKYLYRYLFKHFKFLDGFSLFWVLNIINYFLLLCDMYLFYYKYVANRIKLRSGVIIE